MTKQEVLQDINHLCLDLDNCIWDIVRAAQNHDTESLNKANVYASRMVICAHQELSFLREYINENIKED